MKQKLHEYDGTYYRLCAYVLMGNHIHVLLDFMEQLLDEQRYDLDPESVNYVQLDEVMRRIKGATSRAANLILGTTGQPFWERASYDHYVRNTAEFGRILRYILHNPVQAKLVEAYEDHPHIYWYKE